MNVRARELNGAIMSLILEMSLRRAAALACSFWLRLLDRRFRALYRSPNSLCGPRYYEEHEKPEQIFSIASFLIVINHTTAMSLLLH